MKKRYLIVENNHGSLSALIEQVSMLVGPADFKVALNGGHAYLHLDHLHLSGKFEDLEVVILLNIHTPLSNGFEFLNSFKANHDFPKNRIRILVLKDNLSSNEIEQLKSFNVELFTMNTLSDFFKNSNSSSPADTQEERVFIPVSDPTKNNKRGFAPGQARV